MPLLSLISILAGLTPAAQAASPLEGRAFVPEQVIVGFADGHTAFVTNSIDYIAYQSLMTPDNAKSSMLNPAYQLKPADLGN